MKKIWTNNRLWACCLPLVVTAALAVGGSPAAIAQDEPNRDEAARRLDLDDERNDDADREDGNIANDQSEDDQNVDGDDRLAMRDRPGPGGPPRFGGPGGPPGMGERRGPPHGPPPFGPPPGGFGPPRRESGHSGRDAGSCPHCGRQGGSHHAGSHHHGEGRQGHHGQAHHGHHGSCEQCSHHGGGKQCDHHRSCEQCSHHGGHHAGHHHKGNHGGQNDLEARISRLEKQVQMIQRILAQMHHFRRMAGFGSPGGGPGPGGRGPSGPGPGASGGSPWMHHFGSAGAWFRGGPPGGGPPGGPPPEIRREHRPDGHGPGEGRRGPEADRGGPRRPHGPPADRPHGERASGRGPRGDRGPESRPHKDGGKKEREEDDDSDDDKDEDEDSF